MMNSSTDGQQQQQVTISEFVSAIVEFDLTKKIVLAFRKKKAIIFESATPTKIKFKEKISKKTSFPLLKIRVVFFFLSNHTLSIRTLSKSLLRNTMFLFVVRNSISTSITQHGYTFHHQIFLPFHKVLQFTTAF